MTRVRARQAYLLQEVVVFCWFELHLAHNSDGNAIRSCHFVLACQLGLRRSCPIVSSSKNLTVVTIYRDTVAIAQKRTCSLVVLQCEMSHPNPRMAQIWAMDLTLDLTMDLTTNPTMYMRIVGAHEVRTTQMARTMKLAWNTSQWSHDCRCSYYL